MSVFRAQVLNKATTPKLGRLVLTHSRLAMPVACASGILVATLISLALLGQVSRKAMVPGLLVPEGGLLSVRASDDAVLAKLWVREGEQVKAGQLLATLAFDRESANSAGLPLSAIVQEQLERERVRLLGEQLGLESGERTRAADLQAQIARAQQRLLIEQDQRTLKQQEFQQASALYQRMKSLGNGSLSLLQVQRYELDVLAAQSTLNEAKLRVLSSEHELADLRRDLKRNSPQFGARASDLSAAIAANVQAIARNANQAEALIRAPHDGEVTALAFVTGQSVQKNARLLYLTPKDSLLEAELWVPSPAAASLRPDAMVSLQLLAFPGQEFGRLAGRIRTISGAAVNPEEIRAHSGLSLPESAYRVAVSFAEREPSAMARSLLRPGMTVRAELRLEQRQLWRAVLGLDALPEPGVVRE